MPILENYAAFNGRYWETGSVHNVFAYCGINAPHTGKPYSDAFLMGVSGGVVMGYFSFAYKGYDPHARILTRNTFDPFDTMLSRLGVVQHRLHTGKPEKGVQNLIDILEEGVPAIVWADTFSLAYNNPQQDDGMWAMFPIVVYGYDAVADTVWIADRANVPLTTTTDELHQARAKVKKDKFRVLTIEPPQPEKLVGAVQAGIWDCINLYTEKPPKGTKNNFGLAAFEYWAKLLTQPKQRLSWEKEFPPGRKMFVGLAGIFHDVNVFGKRGYAERDVYADFLEEAAVLLDKPALREAAAHFRTSTQAWEVLGPVLLPDDVAPFREARALMLQRRDLFHSQGNAALPTIQQIDDRLNTIKTEMETDFPLDEAGVVALREALAEHVMQIHDIEETAVMALRDAMV